MKLDKKATKIVLGCIICTVIVGLLLLVAFRFSSLSCELIKVDPQALKHSQMKAFEKEKPERAHDKKLLLKIAAYLEYNLPKSGSKSSSSSSSSDSSHQNNNNNNNNNNNTSINQQQTLKGQHQATGQQKQPQQVAGQQIGTSRTVQPGQNSSTFVTSAPAFNGGWQPSPSSAPIRVEKRFLPMELDDIETKNLDDNRTKYKLQFNCSTLNMVFVRQPNRVHVESMSLELEPSSRHKTKCDIQMPPSPPVPSMPANQLFASGRNNNYNNSSINNNSNYNNNNNNNNNNQSQPMSAASGLFGVESRDGFGHYLSKSAWRFNCHHKSKDIPSSSSSLGLLLVELNILAIEFESVTGNNQHEHVKKEFQTRPFEAPQQHSNAPIAQ